MGFRGSNLCRILSPNGSKVYSMWKFHDFSITHILREINFGDSNSAKSANKHIFGLRNFDFDAFLHFLKG